MALYMGNLGYNPTLDFQPPPEKIFGPPKIYHPNTLSLRRYLAV